MLEDALVVNVSDARCTHMIHDVVISVLCRLHVHRMRGHEVGAGHRRGVVVVGDERAVERAVAVAVEIVAAAVEMIGSRPVVEIFGRTVRACDEVVVYHVLIVVGRRVSADDAHAVVVHHVVVVLQEALHLRVTALVVGPQTMVYGPVARAVSDGAEALGLDALTVDAILPGDVVGILDVHVVPRTPRHGTVVHDEVLASVERQGAFAAVHAFAAAHTDVAYDDILGIRGNHATAVDGDTLARSRLSGDGDIAGNGDALAGDVDHAAHVKNDEAPRLTHGVGQRSRAGSVQIRHVDHLASTAAGSVCAVTFRTGKCQLLGLQCEDTYRHPQREQSFFHCNMPFVFVVLLQIYN